MNQSTNVDSTYSARCRARLADLVNFCAAEYQLPPHYIHLIASALLPCHPYRPIWLVIESSRHPFWEDLNKALPLTGNPQVEFVSWIRMQRMKSGLGGWRFMKWMEQREVDHRILVDTAAGTSACWRGMHNRHAYWEVCRESIRAYMPLEMPKALPAIDTHKELARLLNLVIDRSHRRLLPVPVELPQRALNIATMIQSINKEVEVTPALYENLGLVPSSHAALNGRNILDDADWEMVRFVLSGSIKQWYRHMLEWYYKHVLGYAAVSRAARIPLTQTFHNDIMPVYADISNTRKSLVRLVDTDQLLKKRRYKKADGRMDMSISSIAWDMTEKGEELAKLVCAKEYKLT